MFGKHEAYYLYAGLLTPRDFSEKHLLLLGLVYTYIYDFY